MSRPNNRLEADRSPRRDLPMGAGPVEDGAILKLPGVRDAMGAIIFVEGARDLPFAFKRVYYFYDMPSGQRRGRHAHRNCETFLIAARGRIRVDLDDGRNRQTYILADPDQGILVPRMVWLEVTLLSPDSLCLVLASEYYEAEDHVSDYDQFLREVAAEK